MVVGMGICFQTGSEMGMKFEIYGNENGEIKLTR